MSEGLLWALGEADANLYICSEDIRSSEEKFFSFFFHPVVDLIKPCVHC